MGSAKKEKGMSDRSKPVTQKHFEEVSKRLILATVEMHLELLALEKALQHAGVLTDAQLRQGREDIAQEAVKQTAALSDMLQSSPKGGKGPVD
jgi:hypothetical protein